MERSRPHADAEATLATRARLLAQTRDGAGTDEIVATVVLVRLDTERLGLPAEHMQGVYDDVVITELVGTPPWIAGIAQVRGELMSVVHLSHWLGQSAAEARPVVAVIATPAGPLGFLVDEVVGSCDVHQQEVSHHLTRQAHREQRPIRLVTSDLVAVVDLDRLLEHPDLIVGRRRPGEQQNELPAQPERTQGELPCLPTKR